MRLHTLVLEEYCQYAHKEITFSPGVNLIVGPNGAGKSNAMKAPYAAITNDFGRNPGVKLANVRHGRPEGARSRITLVVSHNDATMEVVRGLSPDANTLSVRDAAGREVRRLRGADAVTDGVLGILGVPAKLLADYVFVEQWGIFSFLSMLPAARAKALQRLFGTEQAAALYDALGRHAAGLPTPTTGAGREVIAQQARDAAQRAYDAGKALAEAAHVDESYRAAEDEARNAAVTAWGERQELLRRLGKLEGELLIARKEAAKAADEVDGAEGAVLELREAADAARASADEARAALSQFTLYKQLQARHGKLLYTIAALEKEIEGHLVPVPMPEGYIPLHERAEALRDYEADRSDKETAAKYLREVRPLPDGSVTCPTCGTRADHLTAGLEEYTALLARAEQRCSAYYARDAVTRKYDKHMDERRRAKGSTETMLAEKRRELASVDMPAKPGEGEDALRAQVVAFAELEKVLQEREEHLATWRGWQSRAAGKLDVLTRDEVELRVQLDSNPGNEFTAKAARADMTRLEEAAAAKRQQRREQQSAQEASRRAAEAMAALDAVEAEAEALEAWRGRLGAMQGVVHHGALPKVLARTNMEILQDDVNDMLARFESDFRVEADDDLTFTAHFHKGAKAGASQTAGRLSGGEKVVLAIAFRVAVNALFARDLGLLVLDEPTAGLDAGNMGCLGLALGRLSELSRSRGLQVVIITHEPNLPAADNVIDLGVVS